MSEFNVHSWQYHNTYVCIPLCSSSSSQNAGMSKTETEEKNCWIKSFLSTQNSCIPVAS